ncbi:g1486 [Coccomyxa viridis]|uniref:G1486 protein n=1 Tax=Coccomyxa viridis TaxID=1274662 RepID=A0ABP1FI71_9CHLO
MCISALLSPRIIPGQCLRSSYIEQKRRNGDQQAAGGTDRAIGMLRGQCPRTAAADRRKRTGRARTALGPEERGQPSWGAYLTPTDSDGVSDGPTRGSVVVTLSAPERLSFNVTLNKPFSGSDPLQSILISKPAFINSTAATLATLVGGNASNTQLVTNPDGGVTITGYSAPPLLGDVPFQQALANLSWGRAMVNVYTANYPEPADPMGCCNNAELRSEGSLEPLNAASLPPGGLRQDHHGYEDMPVSPADARPYSAVLVPNDSTASLTNATGMVSLLVAPDNSSITYNVTLGNLAPGNEIYNVSIWFGKGPARQLGWFPYSLYSFASNRLPTPRGGLLVPGNGANFTLATGWIGSFVEKSPLKGITGRALTDPTYSFGVQQLAANNVYIVIGTADFPKGELEGQAVLGWPASE